MAQLYRRMAICGSPSKWVTQKGGEAVGRRFAISLQQTHLVLCDVSPVPFQANCSRIPSYKFPRLNEAIMPSAVRVASAMIVKEGFTPALVTNTLPSAM